MLVLDLGLIYDVKPNDYW